MIASWYLEGAVADGNMLLIPINHLFSGSAVRPFVNFL